VDKIKPTLVIMAAGLGSRYGGLKQMAPVDDAGHIIIDYSLYDAYRAGFKEVVCIINPKNQSDFEDHFRNTKDIKISYAHQTLDKLPQGFQIPDGRTKPWGTAHAVLCAKDLVNGPFAVINADDFYGAGAFKLIYDFLETKAGDANHAMVGYKIENTLTKSGSVARGICSTQGSRLVEITETMEIVPAPGGAAYPQGEEMIHVPAGTLVSMNMWGFGHKMFSEIENRFAAFLTNGIAENPLKCEYLLPSVVGELLGEVTVDIIPTVDRWYGVTYANDMPGVRSAIKKIKESGAYPQF